MSTCTMSVYEITLLVTWEQEAAITRLFKEMCWQFNKTNQQQVSRDQYLSYDQLNTPLSNNLPDTFGLNSQSDQTATDPVISCVSEIQETDENTKAYHCHEIIKTETNIVDTSTAYCKLCNDSSEKVSTSTTKDLTVEASKETLLNPAFLLDSKLSQTDISLAPLDETTVNTFRISTRRSPRFPRAATAGVYKETKSESPNEAGSGDIKVTKRKSADEATNGIVKVTIRERPNEATNGASKVSTRKSSDEVKNDVKVIKQNSPEEAADSAFKVGKRNSLDGANDGVFKQDTPGEDTDDTLKVTKQKRPRVSRKRNVSKSKKRLSSVKTASTKQIVVKQGSEIKCRDCGQTFPTKVHLKRHRKSFHAEDLIVKCDKCSLSFPSETEVYIHAIKKHGKGDGKFPCPDCPKVYGFAKTLRNHMHHVHLGLGIPCSVCGKVCSKYDIRSHEAIHRTTKDFKCDLCSAAFKTKAELGIHRRRHTHPYSVYCEICGQGCFSGKELTEHRRIHTGEKPFACSLCDYRCAHKPNLKIHMKVHNKQTVPPQYTGVTANTSGTAPRNTGRNTGVTSSRNTDVTAPPSTGVTAPPNTSVLQTACVTTPINTDLPYNTGVSAPPNTDLSAPLNTGVTGPLHTGLTGPLNTGFSGLLNTGVSVNTGVPINLTYNTHERQQQVDAPRNTGVNANMIQNTHERQQQSEYRFAYKPYLFYP